MPADDTTRDERSEGTASSSTMFSDQETAGSERSTSASAKQGLQDVQQRVRESGRSAVRGVRKVSKETGEEIRARGEEMVDRQKNRAADHIGNYSAAAKRAADQLRDEHDEVLAHYADTIAGTLERAADYLRTRDLNDMVGIAERYARRHPEVVLGGMFVAGLAAARFFKAAHAPEDWEDEEEYRVDYAYEEYGPGDDTGYAIGSERGSQEAATGTAAGPGAVHSTL